MSETADLVLLPGLLSTAAVWDRVLALTAGQVSTFAVERLDHPSIGEMAEDVLKRAPSRFHLAGHSMGGYVALEVVRQAPARISSLTLVNTSARPDTPEQTQRRLRHLSLLDRGRFRGVSRRLLASLVARPESDPDLLLELQAMAEQIGPEGYVNQQCAIMSRPDARAGLRAIACPTFVVGGREDELTPPEASYEIYQTVPQCSLSLLEGCGHMAPLEQPQHVAHALIRLQEWAAS